MLVALALAWYLATARVPPARVVREPVGRLNFSRLQSSRLCRVLVATQRATARAHVSSATLCPESEMKRLLLAFLLLIGIALRAEAEDYTDIWYNAQQPGYGFNFIQSDLFIFATFFVYGFGGQPTWLVAGLNYDGVSAWTGNLYAATGTYYGAPWDPAAYVPTPVGTATFTPNPNNNWQGTLNYIVQSGAVAGAAADPNKLATAVTVSIERQTLTAIRTGGIYQGAQVGGYSGCTNSANDGFYRDYYELAVTHNQNGSVTYQVDYTSGLSCTLSGVYQLHGQYYEVPNATYTCSDGLDTTANMVAIKATRIGLEGEIHAANVGDNCREDAFFGGPLAD
jgi:hypothetical protein